MPRQKKPLETITPTAGAPPLSPLESFALAKAVGDRQLRELRDRLDVADGQTVDFTVRVRGALNVAGDGAATASEKPPVDQVLAAVISSIQPRAWPVVRLTVRRLFSAWTAGGDLPAIEDRAVDEADDLLATISRSVTRSKRGAVSASLAVEKIEGSEVGGRRPGKKSRKVA